MLVDVVNIEAAVVQLRGLDSVVNMLMKVMYRS